MGSHIICLFTVSKLRHQLIDRFGSPINGATTWRSHLLKISVLSVLYVTKLLPNTTMARLFEEHRDRQSSSRTRCKILAPACRQAC
jgi:hypothetical protein